MSWQKSINEIASLLAQTGTPAGHAQDIAARLSNALSGYYDSRQSAGQSQEVNAESSQSPSFQRAFKPPEAFPGGKEGEAGKDGQWAWAVGADGKDGIGQDGLAGQDGASGQDGGVIVVGGGGISIADLTKWLNGFLNCKWFSQKFKDCVVNGKDKLPGDATFCRQFGQGMSVCDILDKHATTLKQLEKEIDKLKDRVDDLEKQLKDTVDCP